MLNAPYISWLDSLTYGTKMPRISPDQVAGSFVALPSTAEQRAIAAFLDRETARIDALVAKKERLIALLQEQRTALITRAVTKGLDPTVPMKNSGVEWLGEIPAHWEVKPNAALFHERNERGRQDLPILEVSIASGVKLREFSDARIEQRSDDLGAYKVAKHGDIAFNEMRMWQGAVGATPKMGSSAPTISSRNRILIHTAPTTPRCCERRCIWQRCTAGRTESWTIETGSIGTTSRPFVRRFRRLMNNAPSPPSSTARPRASTPSSPRSARRTALIFAAVTGKIDVSEG